MNYQQTLSYLFSQLPMYQRVGKMAYKANLDTTIALDEYFNHPHTKYKTIHVAGTNGKGSTSHMLASVLMDAGYKVGLYTSPHIKSFRERIRINSQMVSEQFVVEFTAKHQQIFEKLKPSFFEMTVAMAFEYFAEQKVDIAVIEVGLGGRLDSTNIIAPELSIITNIGFDHTNLLGNTLAEIATEKAGVIKQNTPVIIGENQPEISSIFKDKAKSLNAPIYFASNEYLISTSEQKEIDKQYFSITKGEAVAYKNLSIDLLGEYQAKNLPSVLCAIDLLVKKGYTITKHNITNGLSNTIANTGLLGRWQIISKNPLTICDTGHNVDGIAQIARQIKNTPHSKTHMVIGMVGDKNIEGILKLLPKNATYYFTKANIPRALNELELANKAKSFGLVGNTYQNVEEALGEAKKNAHPNDLIFIGGSTFTVADALILE
ncbi:MAG TPA: bifunctional folylpolyglutamate synthase/dihydrofolate synthase [Bacteroidetes bacterium]|nr:bifunctional folylpolyglutamate synthase/dihydrofolate synthase [Bacteroidota bacterium]